MLGGLGFPCVFLYGVYYFLWIYYELIKNNGGIISHIRYVRHVKRQEKEYRRIEEAYKKGKLRAIGVSNFLVDDLENIINNSEIKPMANQILLHIGETPVDVIKFCQENDIVVEAYSPIAHGKALNDKTIADMADKYKVSIPQLCIKYTLQLDTISIPKASSKEHIEDNMKLDFEIKEEDMIELMKLNRIDYGDQAFWPVFNKKKQG